MSHDFSNFKPDSGSNLSNRTPINRSNRTTYGNVDRIRDDIETLIKKMDNFQALLEQELRLFAIEVGDFDPKLKEAHDEEWPNENLGQAPAFVSYRLYKALRFRNTTSAFYIRHRFEEAARDVVGTSALDLHLIAEMTRDEALLIRSFLDTYIGSTYDTSEQRVLEVFQDWVKPALVQADKLRTYYETGQHRRAISEKDISAITSADARKAQSLFKAKLNASNESIVKNLDFLNRNFTEFGSTFYERFLGPALKFRGDVSSKSYPNGTTINHEVQLTSAFIDENLKVVIADQSRRRSIYQAKTSQILKEMQSRDRYRNSVKELSGVGKSLPSSGPRVLVEALETPEEVEFWDVEYESNIDVDVPISVQASSTGSIISSHGALTGRDAPDAHSQYLLRSGGLITGDVDLSDGVLIDNMSPSGHTHTGKDGTSKIHGSNILEGTLDDDSVDSEAKPPTPTNLSIESFSETVVPPGVTSIDAVLVWDGDPSVTNFEVQITRI